MTANQYVELHHPEDKPPRAPHTQVTFRSNSYDQETARPWGVLHVEIVTSDGNGGSHSIFIRHFLHGADWQMQSVMIQQAFRDAAFRP